MPYKKSPASFMKHKSKAVGYMMKGSAFHLDTDPSPERQARLDKMKAEREAARAIKRKEYDAKRQAVVERQMKKSIEQDTARNIRRQAIIEKRKQKDPSYKLKQKQIVTGQQHLQAGTTPLEMHGPGGTHPDPKKKPTTTLSNALASDEDYQVVPGYEQRLGGALDEVVVTASARNNTSNSGGALPTKRKKKKRKTYSKTGNLLRGINPFSTKHERVRARTRLGQDRFL